MREDLQNEVENSLIDLRGDSTPGNLKSEQMLNLFKDASDYAKLFLVYFLIKSLFFNFVF